MGRVLHSMKLFRSVILHLLSVHKFRRNHIGFGCKFKKSHRERRDEQGHAAQISGQQSACGPAKCNYAKSLKAGRGFDTNGYIQSVALNLGPM